MFSESQQDSKGLASAEQEAPGRIDGILERILSGELAERILDAARLAYVQEMCLVVSEKPSKVESEHSAA